MRSLTAVEAAVPSPGHRRRQLRHRTRSDARLRQVRVTHRDRVPQPRPGARPSSTSRPQRCHPSGSTATSIDVGQVDDGRLALDGLARAEHARRRSADGLLPRRGRSASSGRPRGQAGLRLRDDVPAGGAACLRLLRPARPQGGLPRHGDRPTDWIVLGNGAAQQTEPGSVDACRDQAACRPTSPRWWPGPITRSPPSTTASCSGCTAGRPLRAHLDKDAEELFTVTGQCFDEYHRLFGIRYPFGEYHQAFVPGVQRRRDGEPWLRDVHRRPGVQGSGHGLAARGPRQRRGARDGTPVVRRPGHDEVVGRPLAQRVVRGVHGLPRPPTTSPSSTTSGSSTPSARRHGAWPPTSARRRHPIAGNGARDAQQALTRLRRDLLQQGRSRPAPAQRLPRRGGVHRRRGRPPRDELLRQRHAGRPARLLGPRQRQGRHAHGREAWLRTKGVDTPQRRAHRRLQRVVIHRQNGSPESTLDPTRSRSRRTTQAQGDRARCRRARGDSVTCPSEGSARDGLCSPTRVTRPGPRSSRRRLALQRGARAAPAHRRPVARARRSGVRSARDSATPRSTRRSTCPPSSRRCRATVTSPSRPCWSAAAAAQSVRWAATSPHQTTANASPPSPSRSSTGCTRKQPPAHRHSSLVT